MCSACTVMTIRQVDVQWLLQWLCAVRAHGSGTEVFGDGGLGLGLALDIVSEDKLGRASRVRVRARGQGQGEEECQGQVRSELGSG